MPEWYSVLSCCIRPLFSVGMMQIHIGIMLQKIMLSKQAPRVLPPPTFQYLVFRGTQQVLQLSEQLAVRRPGPDDVSKANKYSSHTRTGTRGTHTFRVVRSDLF